MRLIVMTIVAMVAFAANSILNRMAVDGAGMAPLAFAAVRLMAGAVVLAVLVRLRGAELPLGGRGRIIGVVALLVYAVGFSMAYQRLDAGLGALILFGLVQITMFAAAVLAREGMPVRRWIGAGVAFAGLVWLLSPGGGTSVPVGAALMMALAGVAWGFYSLAGRAERDPIAGTAANFIWAAPLGCLVWWGFGATGLSGADWSNMGAMLAIVSGAVTSGLGYALWYQLVPQLGASRAAVAQLSVPVIAALAGAVLLAEAPSLRLIGAGILVLGGVALSLSAGSVRAGRK